MGLGIEAGKQATFKALDDFFLNENDTLVTTSRELDLKFFGRRWTNQSVSAVRPVKYHVRSKQR
jgi:isopentenyldiphosphate isomerase